jgi:hypothetical protein
MANNPEREEIIREAERRLNRAMQAEPYNEEAETAAWMNLYAVAPEVPGCEKFMAEIGSR